MSLLRIRCSLADAPARCQWALVNDGREPVAGEGPIEELPRRAGRIQLVIPAEQVLITRARLPHAARRHAGPVLAFAIEDETVGEPDANQVSWLGAAGDFDVLAAVDKPALTRWRDALDAVDVRGYEVHCETLLLPWAAGEWSFAWNGREGFVRTGEIEGAATDCGDRDTPPLSLRLMLEEAQARGAGPAAIALYTAPGTAPDSESWMRALGVAVRPAGIWDWRAAAPGAGVGLAQEHQRWRAFTGAAARLRPAAWILGAALAIHAAALVADWTSLASEQRALRRQMESRFRAVFPDAVAVADPALQMRRKLAGARHAAGQPDSGDFLPMIEQVAAAAAKELSPGAVRAVAFESGRLTLELAAVDEAVVRRIVARLAQSGLSVGSSAISKHASGATVVLTVRAS